MPYRAVVSAELARLFGVLSHPIRIRIIEELQREDLTVGSLRDILGITHAAVSQQLSVLRSHHLVAENRQGRNVFYHLRKPALAKWIMDGTAFISPDTSEVELMVSAIKNVQTIWAAEEESKKKASKKASAAKGKAG
ncbi:MAG: metalloregulator ArsR/SmtB family transcription factor [Candidatus Obscuribacterales bacterium]|nr:metalloregulator ArsR/SmtB family transcription factor [Candidatus Obscuribacterales bacterium]